jgi:hypothetical protein
MQCSDLGRTRVGRRWCQYGKVARSALAVQLPRHTFAAVTLSYPLTLDFDKNTCAKSRDEEEREHGSKGGNDKCPVQQGSCVPMHCFFLRNRKHFKVSEQCAVLLLPTPSLLISSSPSSLALESSLY